MTTKALDLLTMGHALNELSSAYLGDCEWRSTNEAQKAFLAWYGEHRSEIDGLSGLEALASTEYTALNAFLVSRGFKPLFDEFKGVGVASILDMLVEWVAKGDITTVDRYDSTTGYVAYPAFQIGGGGAQIFDVQGYDQPLIRLVTASGHGFWLMKAEEPATGIELALAAQAILASSRSLSSKWTAGVKVPMLEIDVQPDLSWMVGANTDSPKDGYHVISQAFQQFKLRANEIGARVKVATGFATTRSMAVRPVPYAVDEPFVGFFTQPGNDTLPMAAFWADVDSWRNPAGTLEEL